LQKGIFLHLKNVKSIVKCGGGCTLNSLLHDGTIGISGDYS